MNTSSIRTVLFDLDGTLVDTAADFYEVVCLLCQTHNRTPPNYITVRNTVSKGARALTQLSLGITPDQPDFETYNQQLLDLYIKNISKHSTLFEQMENLFQLLESKHIAWGVVTNKPWRYTEPLLKNLKLLDRCASIICPDHVRERKPNPEGLLLACQQIGCTPQQAIYVGDDERDIQAGKKAGFLATIAALYGYVADSEQPDNWQADYNARTVADLIDWLTPRL